MLKRPKWLSPRRMNYFFFPLLILIQFIMAAWYSVHTRHVFDYSRHISMYSSSVLHWCFDSNRLSIWCFFFRAKSPQQQLTEIELDGVAWNAQEIEAFDGYGLAPFLLRYYYSAYLNHVVAHTDIIYAGAFLGGGRRNGESPDAVSYLALCILLLSINTNRL